MRDDAVEVEFEFEFGRDKEEDDMPVSGPKEHLRTATELWRTRLTNDLRAAADGSLNSSPGGCARSAIDIVVECGMVYAGVADYLNGGEFAPPRGEEAAAFRRGFTTVDAAIAYLDEQTDRLLAVIPDLDEATLWEPATGFLNRPMTRFSVAELPATHMAYHDGQLNYIHTLGGDDQVHW